MRRALLLAVLLSAACTAGDSADSVERGGSLVVTRSRIGDTDTLTALASFFAPPGPPETAWPPLGMCDRLEATPTPTATATPIQWRDAGAHVSLHATATLALPRYDTGRYLAPPDSDPASVPLGATFDLEIAGSTAPNGLAAKTIDGALEMPAAPGLAIPDFADGAVALAGTSLGITWSAGATDSILVTVFVSGTSGDVVTLRCSTEDDGAFTIDASHFADLPTGAGILAVTRAQTSVTSLDGTIDLVAHGVAIESGPVLLP